MLHDVGVYWKYILYIDYSYMISRACQNYTRIILIIYYYSDVIWESQSFESLFNNLFRQQKTNINGRF